MAAQIEAMLARQEVERMAKEVKRTRRQVFSVCKRGGQRGSVQEGLGGGVEEVFRCV